MLGFSTSIAIAGVPSAWDTFIYQAAGADPTIIALAKAIVARESEWNPNAINPADPSYGLMQILYGPGGPFPSYTKQQLLDPITNIELGILFLRQQLARYAGDLPSAISAYNAGHATSANQSYVDDVLLYVAWYLANDPLAAGAAAPPTSTSSDTGDTVPSDTTSPPADGSIDTAQAGLGVAGAIALGIAAVVALGSK
jgi:soluble lytic murein transglycosylase-like protein